MRSQQRNKYIDPRKHVVPTKNREHVVTEEVYYLETKLDITW